LADLRQFSYYELGDIVLVRGDGVRVWDRDGNEYLDAVAGTFNLVLGHGHPAVVAAIKAQADELIFASSMFRAPRFPNLRRWGTYRARLVVGMTSFE
jgi:validone 7-phosphate aminotransferase